MKNWVILFARTGSEEILVQMLKERLNAEEYLPFVPIKEMPFRNKGVIHKVRKPLFPGYIFVQTHIESKLISNRLKLDLKAAKDVYSTLHYGDDKNDVVLHESERLFWENLFDENFCIRGSEGFIEGETVRIISGALVGQEGRIKKINRHKREAIVEMKMMGAKREVALMLEIIQKQITSKNPQ